MLTLDQMLFHWINSGLGNPFFDVFLPLVREKWFWAPLYLFLATFVWFNLGRKKGWIFLIGLSITVGMSDFTSSELIKKHVKRLRPCNEPALEGEVVLRISSCGSGYSFTSSHAANHFAVAVFLGAALSAVAPWARIALLGWAALIAFAQVYVGVHYPGDVVCGGLLGAAIGWGMYRFLRRFEWFPRYF